MKSIVVYYSRAGENYFGGQYRYIEVGNTEKVAKIIADKTNSDVFHIEQAVPYADEYALCIDQAKQDLMKKVRPALKSMPEHMDQYDVVYLGYPNYWGDMPMAVYTFLEAFDWDHTIFYPFCTHEGSGLGTTVQKLKEACPKAIVRPGLSIYGSDVDRSQKAIEAWIENMKQ